MDQNQWIQVGLFVIAILAVVIAIRYEKRKNPAAVQSAEIGIQNLGTSATSTIHTKLDDIHRSINVKGAVDDMAKQLGNLVNAHLQLHKKLDILQAKVVSGQVPIPFSVPMLGKQAMVSTDATATTTAAPAPDAVAGPLVTH